jgi:hypothetical protein
MSIIPILHSVARALRRAAHWAAGCFSIAVTSARNQFTRDDLKKITAKVVAGASAAGSVYAGIRHALADPDVLVPVVTALALFIPAFLEGIARYKAGDSKPTDPPVPLPGERRT